MEKEEFPALLPAGIHATTFEQIKIVAVDAFPNSKRRRLLHNNLMDWATKIQTLGVHGFLWIDGSFSTTKENPNDIDLIFFLSPTTIDSAEEDIIKEIKILLDRSYVATAYNLDLYIMSEGLPTPEEYEWRKSYWRGWFGFCRDGKTAKGMWEVII